MGRKEQGRFSARRKAEAVLRLLRGEELDAVSRELKVTAATLAQWRDEFTLAGEAGLKSRARSGAEEEIRRLRAKVGELTLDKECMEEIIRRHEARLPLAERRSKP